jgi:hypothetical protein
MKYFYKEMTRNTADKVTFWVVTLGTSYFLLHVLIAIIKHFII